MDTPENGSDGTNLTGLPKAFAVHPMPLHRTPTQYPPHPLWTRAGP
jgi:hypothetical protein